MTGFRLLRLPEVLLRTGLARDSIYRLEREGKFPSRVKLSERATAWREAEVEKWIADRPKFIVGKKRACQRPDQSQTV